MLLMLLLIFLPITKGLNHDSLVFSIDYFNQRNVPFICLLSCEESSWNLKFIKQANNLSMAVSTFKTDDGWQQRYRLCMKQKYTFIGVLMVANCEHYEEIFYIASQNMWFDFRHIWLIIDNNSTLDVQNITVANLYKHNIVKELDNMNISVDTDIIMALQTGRYYKLFDLYNFGKVQGGNLNVIDIGLKTNLNDYKYYRRWNFGQWKMRLVSVIASPSKEFDVNLLTSLSPVTGVSVVTRTTTNILMVVGEVHNITFVHKITDRWMGSFDDNKTRAVVNYLYLREQDVTTVLRFLKVMYGKIDLIHPSLTSLETKYYYRIPTTGPGKYENQFLRPLSQGTWWSTVAVCAICTIILLAAAIYEQRPSTVQYAFFSVMASVCQQFFEDDNQVRNPSGARKLIIFVTGLFCLIIYNYYTSSVVSWLLNGPPPTLNSLQELIDSSLNVILEDTGYARTWLNNPGYYFNKRFANEEDQLRKRLVRKKDRKPVSNDVFEGISLLKAGGYAFHTETDNANRLISEKFTQTEICEVGSLPSMEKTLLYPGLQYNSPYKEFLSWSLTRLLERGVVSCVQKRTLAPSISCEASMPRALALGGAAPAFILLTMGFVLATGIMFIERLIYKRKTDY